MTVLAYNWKSFEYYRIGNPGKLCDGTIAANLPVARYDGANQWTLKSEHSLYIKSYGEGFGYYYGWANGWCPADGAHEGDWWDCDQYDIHNDQYLNANSSVNHTKYNWWYTENANVATYRAVASSTFQPNSRYNTAVSDHTDVTR